MLFAKSSTSVSAITEKSPDASLSDTRGDNPLIWPLLSLLKASNRSWKVHHLATKLQQQGLMHHLDNDQQKALFKTNFLLMNALFELQQLLLPQHWLQVKAMEIQIFRVLPRDLLTSLKEDDALRDYYLNWLNYDTCPNIIQEMLESFWNRYEDYIGTSPNSMHCSQALSVFELDNDATDKQIRKQWCKLALIWHPDRPNGDAAQFRKVCEAWQTLRDKH